MNICLFPIPIPSCPVLSVSSLRFVRFAHSCVHKRTTSKCPPSAGYEIIKRKETEKQTGGMLLDVHGETDTRFDTQTFPFHLLSFFFLLCLSFAFRFPKRVQ